MRKSFFTRQELQAILEKNPLNAEVTYTDRESGSPENFIVYFRLAPSGSTYADDKLHMRQAYLQVSHYHKAKLDSIEQFMRDEFNVEPVVLDLKAPDTDYLATHYRFPIFTSGRW